MRESTVNLNDRTTVPLFAVVIATLSAVGAYGGMLLFISAISAKVDVATAHNIQQDERTERIEQIIKEQRANAEYSNASLHRIEGMLEILLDERGIKVKNK